ncbi:Nup133 N terminal like-domain-containing protein [Phycomyces blakesleeanus]|uniref:Nup133 N terminal like-domain-containing protein n=1 Tax=Phycomyces blakesleeanus TaxID=4837 RepID=A0ABR3AN77_PHYBL
MSETSLSESDSKAIVNAFEALDTRAVLDRRFPDIGDAFAAPSDNDYLKAAGTAVLPIVVRQSLPLPKIAYEQIRLKPNSPSGILPEINRAYFAIGKRLYFVDYSQSNELQVFEESSEIVGIELVKPKPDVFSKEITHVLVIATVDEIKIVPVSLKKTDTGNTLSLYSSGLTTPSGNVHMTSFVGTPFGRIFMLGNDGNLWELIYKSTEGWFNRKCYKQLHQPTTSFSFLFMSLHDPCVAISASTDGRVLYQLHQSSSIQVTYLGEDGQSFITKTKKSNILQDVHNSCPQLPLNSENFKFIALYATSPEESTKYQLIAITSDGCRLYFTHFKSSTQLTKTDPPDTLELIHVRRPPPSLNPQFYPTVFKKAIYKDSTMFLVGTGADEGKEIIMSTSPDIGKLANLGARSGLTELMDQLEVQGKVFSIVEIPSGPFELNELLTDSKSHSRYFLVLTSLGLTVLKKQRPIDMLKRLLSSVGKDVRARADEYETFFAHFGPASSSALCYELACSEFSNWSPCPQLTGDMIMRVTDLLETLGQTPSPIPPSFSSRHDGLALYLGRLIKPVRTHPLVVDSHNIKNKPSKRAATREELVAIQRTLLRLKAYIDQNASIFHHLTPRTNEDQSIYSLYKLIELTNESITDIVKRLP